MMTVDGIELDIPPFTPAEVDGVVRPLANDIGERLDWIPRGRRCMVGICGPPGSGKSVFARRLLHYLVSGEHVTEDAIAYLPVDGYHFPNRVLDERRYTGDRYPGIDRGPLRSIKGAPETFDVDTLVQELELSARTDRDVRLPAYSRQTHEPVPGRIHIGPATRVILVEGNYLLLGGTWQSVGDLLDMSVFLAASSSQCDANLLTRHLRGGRSPRSAHDQLHRVDKVNHDRVEPCRTTADYVVETQANRLCELVPRTRRGLVIGCGNIGRGLIADMLERSHCHVIFAARPAKKALLERAGTYRLRLYGQRSYERTIDRYSVVDLSDASALEQELCLADAVFMAVGAANILDAERDLSAPLARALVQRSAPLNVFLFENGEKGAQFLRDAVRKRWTASTAALDRYLGIVPCVVDRLVTAQGDGEVLDLCACTWNTTAYDRTAVAGPLPRLWGMVPSESLPQRKRAKMFVANMPQGIASAFGCLRGYSRVKECFRDPAVREVAETALREALQAMASAPEFRGLDMEQIAGHAREFLGYYAHDECRDEVTRVLAQPIRKLQRSERFLAPAELCLGHGVTPTGLARGIAAVLLYDHPEDPEALRLRELARQSDCAGALCAVSGIDPEHPLVDLVKSEFDWVKQSFPCA